MKLRSKILFMCLGCTLVALILQTWLFQETSSSLIYSQAKEESETSLQNMQNELYKVLKNVENNLIEVYTERDLINSLLKESSADVLRVKYYREAYNIATNKFETDDGVVSLYLYTMNHKVISTYRRAVTPKHKYLTDIYEDMDMENAQIVKDYVESDDPVMLVSSYYNPYREKDMIRFVLKLYGNSNRNDKIGYFVCDIDSKVVTDVIDKYRTDSTMFIWLQPSEDRPAVFSGELNDEEKLYYEDISDKIRLGEMISVSYQQKQELFQAEQIKYNLTAYSLMPQHVLRQNQKNLTINLLLIALVMSICAVILTVLISRSIMRPLEKLMWTIQRIKRGDIALRAEVVSRDEIGELGKNFNEMLDQVEELKDKEYQAKQLVAQAEYKALQAQINPHFLYNTLDTMSSIAELRNCAEVSRLSQSLSNIFRYSLNMKEPLSTVGRELTHLKNYIYVMSVRMQNQIQYEFEVDESAQHNEIPRISLQPLVENAINHGLKNKRGEKKIWIRVSVHGAEMHVCVEDNGVGMDASEMNKSLEKNEISYVERGNSIGLHNINARLKLLYGKQYGLRVESRRGEGTCIYMNLPGRSNDEGDRENKL